MITPSRRAAQGRRTFVVTVVALRRRRRPCPTPTDGSTTASSSTRRLGDRAAAETARTCSCRATTTRATRRSSTFRFDVPAGTTAVANGVKLAQVHDRGRSHLVYLQRQPMATELMQLAVGQLRRDHQRLPSPASSCATSPQADHLTAIMRPLLASARADGLDGGARRPLPVRPLRLARRRRRPRLRARDADAVAHRQALVHRLHAGHVGPDAGARALAHVVRRQRLARTRGATCGSTRATRAGTSSSTPRRRASSRATPRATRTTPATRASRT